MLRSFFTPDVTDNHQGLTHCVINLIFCDSEGKQTQQLMSDDKARTGGESASKLRSIHVYGQ